MLESNKNAIRPWITHLSKEAKDQTQGLNKSDFEIGPLAQEEMSFEEIVDGRTNINHNSPPWALQDQVS